MPGFSFVSLQREYRDADLPLLAGVPMTRIDDAIGDFADTAVAARVTYRLKHDPDYARCLTAQERRCD